MFNKRMNLPYAIYCSSEYCKVYTCSASQINLWNQLLITRVSELWVLYILMYIAKALLYGGLIEDPGHKGKPEWNAHFMDMQ